MKLRCKVCKFTVNNGWNLRCRLSFGKIVKLKRGGWSPDWCPRRKKEGDGDEAD